MALDLSQFVTPASASAEPDAQPAKLDLSGFVKRKPDLVTRDGRYKVVDGDTIHELGEQGETLRSLRLKGIDTAELGASTAGVARQRLFESIDTGNFTIKTDGVDHSGERHMAELFDDRGESINARMVREGYSRSNKFKGSNPYGNEEALANADFLAGRLAPQLQSELEANTPGTEIYERTARLSGRDDPSRTAMFARGMLGSVDQLQGSFYGLAHLAGDAMGIDGLKDFGMAGYERNVEEAAQHQTYAPRLHEIESFGDFLDWTAAGLGQVAPSLAMSMTGAGIGAAAGRAVVQRSIRKAVEKALVDKADDALKQAGMKNISRDVLGAVLASPANKKRLYDAALRGGKFGAFGASAAMNTGSIQTEFAERGLSNPLLVLGAGLAAGAMDTLPVAHLLDKAFPGVDRTLSKQFVRGVADLMGKQTLIEGSTEAAQEIIALAALAWEDPTFDFLAKENMHRVTEAAALGALAGAVTGTFGGAYAHRDALRKKDEPGAPPPGSQQMELFPGDPKPTQQAPKPAPEVTEQQEMFPPEQGELFTGEPTATQQPPPTPPPDAADTVASVPVMITNAMRQQLADLGHTPEQVSKMTPEQAHAAIETGEYVGSVPFQGEPTATQEPPPSPPAGKPNVAEQLAEGEYLTNRLDYYEAQLSSRQRGMYDAAELKQIQAEADYLRTRLKFLKDNPTTWTQALAREKFDRASGITAHARSLDGEVWLQDQQDMFGADPMVEPDGQMNMFPGEPTPTQDPVQEVAEPAARGDSDKQLQLQLRQPYRGSGLPQEAKPDPAKLTPAMRRQLADLGHTPTQIDKMTPTQARKAVQIGEAEGTSRGSGTQVTLRVPRSKEEALARLEQGGELPVAAVLGRNRKRDMEAEQDPFHSEREVATIARNLNEKDANHLYIPAQLDEGGYVIKAYALGKEEVVDQNLALEEDPDAETLVDDGAEFRHGSRERASREPTRYGPRHAKDTFWPTRAQAEKEAARAADVYFDHSVGVVQTAEGYQVEMVPKAEAETVPVADAGVVLIDQYIERVRSRAWQSQNGKGANPDPTRRAGFGYKRNGKEVQQRLDIPTLVEGGLRLIRGAIREGLTAPPIDEKAVERARSKLTKSLSQLRAMAGDGGSLPNNYVERVTRVQAMLDQMDTLADTLMVGLAYGEMANSLMAHRGFKPPVDLHPETKLMMSGGQWITWSDYKRALALQQRLAAYAGEQAAKTKAEHDLGDVNALIGQMLATQKEAGLIRAKKDKTREDAARLTELEEKFYWLDSLIDKKLWIEEQKGHETPVFDNREELMPGDFDPAEGKFTEGEVSESAEDERLFTSEAAQNESSVDERSKVGKRALDAPGPRLNRGEEAAPKQIGLHLPPQPTQVDIEALVAEEQKTAERQARNRKKLGLTVQFMGVDTGAETWLGRQKRLLSEGLPKSRSEVGKLNQSQTEAAAKLAEARYESVLEARRGYQAHDGSGASDAEFSSRMSDFESLEKSLEAVIRALEARLDDYLDGNIGIERGAGVGDPVSALAPDADAGLLSRTYSITTIEHKNGTRAEMWVMSDHDGVVEAAVLLEELIRQTGSEGIYRLFDTRSLEAAAESDSFIDEFTTADNSMGSAKMQLASVVARLRLGGIAGLHASMMRSGRKGDGMRSNIVMVTETLDTELAFRSLLPGIPMPTNQAHRRGLVYSLVLAHEFGHGAMRRAYGALPKHLRNRLMKSYESFIADPDTKRDWDYNFDEWLANQTVAYAFRSKHSLRADGPLDRALQMIMAAIDDVLRMFRRHYRLDLEFEQFMYGMILAGRGQRGNAYGDALLARIDAQGSLLTYNDTDMLIAGEVNSQTMVDARMIGAQPQMQAAVARWTQTYPRAVKTSKGFWEATKGLFELTVATLDGKMYRLAERIPVVNEFRKHFHIRAGETSGKFSSTMYQDVQRERARFAGALQTVLRPLSKEQSAAVLREMRDNDGKKNAVYTHEASKKIRATLDEFLIYLRGSGLPVAQVDNYFAQLWDPVKIDADRAGFAAFLAGEGIESSRLQTITDAFTNPPELYDLQAPLEQANDNAATDEDAKYFAPGNMFIKHRLLKDIKDRELASKFQMNDLSEVLEAYLNAAVKRAEFNRRFGGRAKFVEKKDKLGVKKRKVVDWNPIEQWTVMINTAIRQGATRDDVNLLQDSMDRYIGRVGLDMNTNLRKAMSWMMVYQNTTKLLFSAVASIPDLANAVIRTQDVRTVWKAYRKELRGLLKKQGDVWEYARAMGVVSDVWNHHALSQHFDTHYTAQGANQWNERFFRLNGTEWFTNFTRAATLAVGIEFVQDQASRAAAGEAKAITNLKELGLTHADVAAWMKTKLKYGTPGVSREALMAKTAIASKEEIELAWHVGQGLQRFVDSTVMRPDNAQKPAWAADPKWMLVWHLKSFMYSFHKTVINRLWYESTRPDATVKDRMMVVASIAPIFFMAAMALELRELIQDLLGGGEMGRHDRTGKMKGPEYLLELVERSGMGGVGQMGLDMWEAEKRGQLPFVAIAGPTVSQLSEIMGKPFSTSGPKMVPIVSQVPGLRDKLRALLSD